MATTKSKTAAHTRYTTSDGKRVPSVTTVIYNLGWNKGALIAWSRKMALSGEDPEELKREAAATGTLAHAFIEEYIIDQSPHLELEERIDPNQYSGEQNEKAKIAFDAFLEWSDKYKPDYSDDRTATETYMVSDWWKYGGTIDFIVVLDGKLSVVDFKTSNAVYADHRIQLAAYQYLIKENLGVGDDIPTHLLRVDKEGSGYEFHSYPDLSKEWEVFTHLRALHTLRSQVERR